MYHVNQARLLGNVGEAPEIRTTVANHRMALFSMATHMNKVYPQKQETEQHTEWHNIVVFGRLVEVVERYIEKGSVILLEGRIQTRSWINQQNQRHFKKEIIIHGNEGRINVLSRKIEPQHSNE